MKDIIPPIDCFEHFDLLRKNSSAIMQKDEQFLLLVIDRSLNENQLEFSDIFLQNVVQSLKQLFVTFSCISAKISFSKICILESNDSSIEVIKLHISNIGRISN